MYQRQCVSYTAWKVSASGRTCPTGADAATPTSGTTTPVPPASRQTPTHAPATSPSRTAGTYGHAMYVEGVNSDGSINISQYNAAWTGQYSTATIMPSGLVFIHFHLAPDKRFHRNLRQE
jgi:surface antigen